MTDTQTPQNTAPPTGFWFDPQGNLIREENIPPLDRDMDEVVRKIHGFGVDLSAQMYRFREYTMADILAFHERVLSQYETGRFRGRRGNMTLTSFDGRLRVTLSVADVLEAGPEIAAAQSIIAECIDEWSAHAPKNLRALVEQAFKPDDDGRLNVGELLRLRRIQIDDERWRRAQAAITDSLRPRSTAEYIRLYRREGPKESWTQVPLHLATARGPDAGEDTPANSLARRVASAVAEARIRGMKQGDIRDAVNGACARPKRDGEGGAHG